MNCFLKRMEEERKRRGWSKYRLAKESGLAFSTIENLYQRQNYPSFRTAVKIAGALGVKTSELYPADEREEQEEICSILELTEKKTPKR